MYFRSVYRCLLIVIGLGFWGLVVQAQSPLRPGVSLRSSFSYTGINLGLSFDLNHDRFQAFLGPKIVLGRSYLPLQGPWGLITGGRYLFPTDSRWQQSIDLEYQLARFGNSGSPADLIHETFIGYGLAFRINGNFSVGNSLGYGFYSESAYVEQEAKRRSFAGHNGIFRLTLGYEFN